MRTTIHVIDDEQTIREGIAMALGGEWDVRTFEKAEDAIAAIEAAPPDLVLLDIGLPGMDGVEALGRIRAIAPDVLVVMITAYEDVPTVVACMKQGAWDYVVKPIVMDTLEATIRKALQSIRLRREVRALQERCLEDHMPFFVGESEAMQNVMEFVRLVARSPETPVLVTGETGTGKEIVASAIHYRSPLFEGPFVAINCASIPDNLMESELFGYEKGAFSGAERSGKKGLVEEASGGTLFLDEVGDLAPAAQAKLLRFLDSGSFYRVGGTRERSSRCRIVSATNRDLGEMISGGRFRLDLFHRISVVKVTVPSLGQRREDVLPLARHFLVHFADRLGREVTGMTPACEHALLAHEWSGNVRELRNIVERAVLVAHGPEIGPEDLGIGWLPGKGGDGELPEGLALPDLPEGGIDLDRLHRTLEHRLIRRALEIAGGNDKEASRLLGLNYHTFRYRKSRMEEDGGGSS